LRRCVVCLRRVVQSEMRFFTSTHKRRKTWINAVRSTPEGRRALMQQICTMSAPVLCSSHFAPSDFIQKGKRIELRVDAVPFYGVSGQANEEPMNELIDAKHDEPIDDELIDVESIDEQPGLSRI
ncbi:hypothetical protein PMAYCL1PPCAC_27896, partial [Pristionchus mayeri]